MTTEKHVVLTWLFNNNGNEDLVYHELISEMHFTSLEIYIYKP